MWVYMAVIVPKVFGPLQMFESQIYKGHLTTPHATCPDAHFTPIIDSELLLAYNPSMRIMTYNIRGWRTMDDRPNLDAVSDVILAAAPDIVGLNEVFHPRCRVVRKRYLPALEALAQRLEMHFCLWPLHALASPG